jgi:Domain of unknown function (DUF4062)
MKTKEKEEINRKYQVFVSSTYLDLIEARQQVMYALLGQDCIPSGMELFPASNTSQWELIKGVIAECDYYIVVIGCRYGSPGPENNKSYTQMEYEYAALMQKPVIAFVHSNPSSLLDPKHPETTEALDRLKEFRKLVSLRMYKPWTTPDNLASGVVQSLTKLMRDNPAPGWIRGNRAGVYFDEIAELKKQLRRQIVYGKASILRVVQSVADQDLSSSDELMDAVEAKYREVEEERDDNQIVNSTYWWLLIHGVFRFKGLNPWWEDTGINWKRSIRYVKLTERGKMLLKDLSR